MARDVFTGEHAAVAVADYNRISIAFTGQVVCRDFIVFDSFVYGLISAADAFAAIVGADRIVTAAVEGHEIVAESGDMGREKAGGADVKIHLVAVAVHRRALARTIGSVVGSIQRMGRCGNADQLSAHGKTPRLRLDYAVSAKNFCPKNPN